VYVAEGRTLSPAARRGFNFSRSYILQKKTQFFSVKNRLRKKLKPVLPLLLIIARRTSPSTSFLSKMSSSKSVLQTEITSLKATLAERDAQIAALTAAAEAAPAEAPAKKQRKPRDPSKPVMLSPYLVFCAAQRAAHTGPTKLSVKELGVAWKLLSDEQRLSYKAEPAPVKPAKTPKTPKAPKSPKTPKTKKTRDPDAPKKPLSGFMLFSKQQRDAHTGEEKLTAKLLGERWNALTDAEKGAFKSS